MILKFLVWLAISGLGFCYAEPKWVKSEYKPPVPVQIVPFNKSQKLYPPLEPDLVALEGVHCLYQRRTYTLEDHSILVHAVYCIVGNQKLREELGVSFYCDPTRETVVLHQFDMQRKHGDLLPTASLQLLRPPKNGRRAVLTLANRCLKVGDIVNVVYTLVQNTGWFDRMESVCIKPADQLLASRDFFFIRSRKPGSEWEVKGRFKESGLPEIRGKHPSIQLYDREVAVDPEMNWKEISESLLEKYVPNTAITDEMQNCVTRSENWAISKEESALALLRWFRSSITYQPQTSKSNNWDPRSPSTTFKELGGDSIDCAYLLQTQLRALGIKSDICLVIKDDANVRSRPSLSWVEHAILKVFINEDSFYWIDPLGEEPVKTTLIKSQCKAVNQRWVLPIAKDVDGLVKAKVDDGSFTDWWNQWFYGSIFSPRLCF